MRPFDQKRITCPKNHSHRAVLLPHAPDAQLAVAVVPPAQQAAAAHHRAGVVVSRGDGGDVGACKVYSVLMLLPTHNWHNARMQTRRDTILTAHMINTLYHSLYTGIILELMHCCVFYPNFKIKQASLSLFLT